MGCELKLKTKKKLSDSLNNFDPHRCHTNLISIIFFSFLSQFIFMTATPLQFMKLKIRFPIHWEKLFFFSQTNSKRKIQNSDSNKLNAILSVKERCFIKFRLLMGNNLLWSPNNVSARFVFSCYLPFLGGKFQ